MYIHDVRQRFGSMRRLCERALAQVTDEEFLGGAPATSANPIGVLVKHISGYQLSRWTDFLDTDGETTGRDREAEFRLQGETREELMRQWDAGWASVLQALENLTHADLARTVTIRGEPHSVPAAINRSLVEAAYHIGQIVQQARGLRGADWSFLSIPPGGTDAHNRDMRRRFPDMGSGAEPEDRDGTRQVTV
ncbi:MAG: DUF1572 family protein [Gemmatimonadetes bacterium]|nr:DUF1572 family protein [Gemmatimonadota bacterium]